MSADGWRSSRALRSSSLFGSLAGRFVFELGDDPGPTRIGFFQGSDRTLPPGHSRRTYHHIFRKRIVDPEFMGPLDRYFVVYNSGNEFGGGVVPCTDGHEARRTMLNSLLPLWTEQTQIPAQKLVAKKQPAYRAKREIRAERQFRRPDSFPDQQRNQSDERAEK